MCLGRRQRPPGCSVRRQPCTWVNRGADSSKSTDGIWITRTGQWAFQSNTGLNTPKCRVLSSPHSPLSCLEDRSSPTSSSDPQQWGEHPSSSHPFTKLGRSSSAPPPWGADETSPDCTFPSCSLCCHLQPHDSPGGDGMGTGMRCTTHGNPLESHGDCWPLTIAPAELPTAG